MSLFSAFGHRPASMQFYVQRIGADDFMKKPFSRNEVFSRIELCWMPRRCRGGRRSALARLPPRPKMP